MAQAAPTTEDYKLPVCDTQTERRNFPGYMEEQFYTLPEIQEGDTSGTTDTDRDGNTDKGVTKINKKKGK